MCKDCELGKRRHASLDEKSNGKDLAAGAVRRRSEDCVHEEHHVEKHRFLEARRKRKRRKRSHSPNY